MKMKAMGLSVLAAVLVSNSAGATQFHSEPMTEKSCRIRLSAQLDPIIARDKLKAGDKLSAAQTTEANRNMSLNCHAYTNEELAKKFAAPVASDIVPKIPAIALSAPKPAANAALSDNASKPTPVSDELEPIVVTAAKIAL